MRPFVVFKPDELTILFLLYPKYHSVALRIGVKEPAGSGRRGSSSSCRRQVHLLSSPSFSSSPNLALSSAIFGTNQLIILYCENTKDMSIASFGKGSPFALI